MVTDDGDGDGDCDGGDEEREEDEKEEDAYSYMHAFKHSHMHQFIRRCVCSLNLLSPQPLTPWKIIRAESGATHAHSNSLRRSLLEGYPLVAFPHRSFRVYFAV